MSANYWRSNNKFSLDTGGQGQENFIWKQENWMTVAKDVGNGLSFDSFLLSESPRLNFGL